MALLIKIKAGVDKAIATCLLFLMIALVAAVVWQVTSRYLLRMPSTMTDELARFLLIWVGLLGAAYVVGLQKHLNIDLIIARFSPRNRLLVDAFLSLIIAVFAMAVIVFGGAGLVSKVIASGQMASAMQFRIGYVYIILPFSGVIMVFYSVVEIVRSLGEWRKGA